VILLATCYHKSCDSQKNSVSKVEPEPCDSKQNKANPQKNLSPPKACQPVQLVDEWSTSKQIEDTLCIEAFKCAEKQIPQPPEQPWSPQQRSRVDSISLITTEAKVGPHHQQPRGRSSSKVDTLVPSQITPVITAAAAATRVRRPPAEARHVLLEASASSPQPQTACPNPPPAGRLPNQPRNS
jgi:hypothetical protein